MNEPKDWLAAPGGIAQRLRELHDNTALNNKELANLLGWAESKVSRVRNGVTAPSDDDLAAWAQATNAGNVVNELRTLLATAMQLRKQQQTFKQRMTSGQATVQRDYNALVEESQVIRYFETAWVPGFLQTRDYALRVFEEMRELHGPKNDIDEAVGVRLRRQQFLTDTTKRFQLLIDEPVLLRTVTPTEIMVPQLHFLLTWLGAPNVKVGVLPLRGANRRTPQNSFQMYDDLVIVEGFDMENEPESGLYERVFDDLWGAAAIGEDARPLIAGAIKAWG